VDSGREERGRGGARQEGRGGEGRAGQGRAGQGSLGGVRRGRARWGGAGVEEGGGRGDSEKDEGRVNKKKKTHVRPLKSRGS
jgi:hypothetical protein